MMKLLPNRKNERTDTIVPINPIVEEKKKNKDFQVLEEHIPELLDDIDVESVFSEDEDDFEDFSEFEDDNYKPWNEMTLEEKVACNFVDLNESNLVQKKMVDSEKFFSYLPDEYKDDENKEKVLRGFVEDNEKKVKYKHLLDCEVQKRLELIEKKEKHFKFPKSESIGDVCFKEDINFKLMD